MALGADDEQASRVADLFGEGSDLLLEPVVQILVHLSRGEDLLVVGLRGGDGRGYHVLAVLQTLHLLLRHELGVAAQHDVGTAAGHVRRDRDSADLAGSGDYLCLALVILGVEDGVFDALELQQMRELLRFLDGYRADEDRLSLFVAFLYLLYDGVVFAFFVLVDHVRVIYADHRHVGRDLHDVQLVDLAELVLFGLRRAGHTGELGVEAEIVLEGDGREGLVLLLDGHVLLGLDGLMQAVVVAASRHDAAGEGVDDEDLVVLYDVVDLVVHDAVGAHRLLDVVLEGRVLGIGQVLDAEELFGLGDAGGGQHGGALLLVDDVVGVDVVGLLLLVDLLDSELAQGAHELVGFLVQIGGLVALAGYDERRPRLVDQDRVDLVDDGEIVPALHHLLLVDDHVVAQIVEAELVVGAVCDVGVVCGLLLGLGLGVYDQPAGEPEEVVYATHLLGAHAREVLVDSDYVHAVPGQGVEHGRQGGDERLAFAGLHLGYAPLMEHDAAHELYPERAFAEDAVGRLAYDGEGVDEHVVERRAFVLHLAAQSGDAVPELLVGSGLVFVGESLDRVDCRREFFDLTLAVRPEYRFY